MEPRNKYFVKDNGNYRLDSVLGKSVNEENIFEFMEEGGFINNI